MKKLAAFAGVLLIGTLALTSLSAVEWPVEDKSPDSIYSYFGQNVGGKISKSLIFTKPPKKQTTRSGAQTKKITDEEEAEQEEVQNVMAVKDGTILIVMSEYDDDSDFFPSALGTSVILAHDDDIISVYSNLETQSVLENTKDKTSLGEGELIGHTGNTGWQQSSSTLEFQIIDNQKSAAINPVILLPRTEKEEDYSFTGVVLQNKSGTLYDLRESKVFPAGTYKVYHTRNKTTVPYKISCTINGVIEDEIFFDTITLQNGKLYISGKDKHYNSDILYPDENLILTGEITLTPGKSTLGLTSESFLGKQKQLNYQLSIY
ncbi:MAG: M23 family metallopeptidase [Treponema sp.]|nr:M23 family metallopeptidase [Treponema sp.]